MRYRQLLVQIAQMIDGTGGSELIEVSSSIYRLADNGSGTDIHQFLEAIRKTLISGQA